MDAGALQAFHQFYFEQYPEQVGHPLPEYAVAHITSVMRGIQREVERVSDHTQTVELDAELAFTLHAFLDEYLRAPTTPQNLDTIVRRFAADMRIQYLSRVQLVLDHRRIASEQLWRKSMPLPSTDDGTTREQTVQPPRPTRQSRAEYIRYTRGNYPTYPQFLGAVKAWPTNN